jgi:multiple RNA-binding domain-containing protein 1
VITPLYKVTYQSLPLYLEWSPENIFSSALEAKAEKTAEQAASTDEVTAVTEEKIEEITGSIPTVYIKNLNFATTEPILKEAFFKLKGFQSARLATKPDPKNQTARLSMGFGFLEFKSREEAKQAMKIIQGTMLDGHMIQCKMSNGKQSTTQKTREKDDLPQSTKIMIRNIPFEATKREIRALFTYVFFLELNFKSIRSNQSRPSTEKNGRNTPWIRIHSLSNKTGSKVCF